MDIEIKKYEKKHIDEMMKIWNEVVKDAEAFPQEETLTEKSADAFFEAQTYCGVAVDKDSSGVIGMYILHPNNVGRCSHIANASFAVSKNSRGLHIGEKLVLDCLEQAKNSGFKIMQFNAVVKSNIHARNLYERLGFKPLGEIPGGFRMGDDTYSDICLYYKTLT